MTIIESITKKIVLAIVVLGLASRAVAAPPVSAGDSPITQPVFQCGSDTAARGNKPSFESIPSRPLALSEDGSLLFAVNTGADCLEIFDLRDGKMVLASTVRVGVEPVAVAARNRTELWVVNHLSDSVSIVDIGGMPRVKQTLQVGDEPWDVVFADNGKEWSPADSPKTNRRNRAYISAAYRGQSHPQFNVRYLRQNRLMINGKPGEQIGRADLWVFDCDAVKPPVLSGLINLFTNSVRSLAVNEEGSRVYAASFKSGNRTAVIGVGFNDLLSEKWSTDGVGDPEPRLIIQQQDDKWTDERGRDWSGKTDIKLADNDLFVIDPAQRVTLGNADHPVFNRKAIVKTLQGLGTILFNVHASGDRVYVSGIDSHNTVALEENLKEKFVTNFVASINTNTYAVDNISLDDLALPADKMNGHLRTGTALPAGMATDGNTLYLAAMGGNAILRLDASSRHAEPIYNNGGPVGMEIDSQHHRLFVYTRFDHRISVYDTDKPADSPIDSYAMQDGEPDNLRQGRRYFYDATLTSAKGNVACASCHIFGGTDKLQWDLGTSRKPLEINELGYIPHPNPAQDLKTLLRTIELKANPDSLQVGDTVSLGNMKVPVVFKGDKQSFADQLDKDIINVAKPGLAYLRGGQPEKRLYKYNMANTDEAWVLIDTPFFHPLKGPMLTLPLYGIADSGPLHFRGDMQGKLDQAGKSCPSGNSVEERALKEFNTPCDGGPGTFERLLGGRQLDDQQMQALADFLLSLTYPPNPVRPLDNSYLSRHGASFFFDRKTMSDIADMEKLFNRRPLIFHCQDCHTLSREERKFGTSTLMYSAPVLTRQDAKIPHLRFLYDRVGYFPPSGPGQPPDEDINAAGFNHGGMFGMDMFVGSLVWVLDDKDGATPGHVMPQKNYEDLFSFLMAFDTNLFPMYGQQLTLAPPVSPASRSGNASQFRRYAKAALFPANTDKVQCSIHYDMPEPDHSSQHRVITRDSLSDASGRYSEEKTRKFLASLAKESTVPVTFTCL